jgi:hypothetical protein
MQNETKSPRLQQTKYTYMVYIGVDKINTLGWKKGDKLVIDLVDKALHIRKDERFVEVAPDAKKEVEIIAEVQPPPSFDKVVVQSAVSAILKGVV